MECWSFESLLHAQPRGEALFDTQEKNVSEWYVSISTFKPSFGGMRLSRYILKECKKCSCLTGQGSSQSGELPESET